ncbi:hypothetical protein CHLRE_14g627050v5 [Chlamydomonas reinhardtii]|uniref:Uncharacterized protein n=1 Tax=Chlamydomonas reinhardtii TaxID=3055 RepID=A0A2K3CYF1_CHLRE|nr:uncharacterized protein CHLRE_14g627050v5 [Chlamydomonas reinhardtii]PNW73300.1 hypothetical protein CHLRE_14g627050v5 [Chlamydomonas reinhardtii]
MSLRPNSGVLAPTKQARKCAVPTPARKLVIMQFRGPNREAAREKSQNVDGLEVADAEPWRRSVDTMLHRAASSLQRGPCTCLSCRGGGTVECAQCKGAGRLGAAAMERSQLLRGAFRQLRMAVGLSHEVPYCSSEYMVSNRCPRCHGQGRLLCELCTGSGLRFPHLAKNHWRQCAGQPGAEGVAPDTECTLPE